MNYETEYFIKDRKDEENEDKDRIYSSLFFSACFVSVLWIIQIFQHVSEIDLTVLGIFPGKTSGLKGILFSPLIHSGYSHLISNSVTLFFLLFGILYFYRNSAVKVFFIIYFSDGILVWLFARPSYHIGASGILYGLAAFLFFSGVFRKDKRSISLSMLIVFLYGGMVWGVLPTDPHISFESHLFGAVVGIFCAFIFRNNDPPAKYEWEDENDEYSNDGYDDYDDGKEPEDAEIDEDAEPDDFKRLF